MSRTPLMRLLRRAMHSATQNDSRRDFVRTAAMAGVAMALPSALGGCIKPSELNVDRSVRVAVVGAGLAGLHAAWLLQNKGINVNVYEASRRVGGRCMTSHNLLVHGTWTELGGEFIDSGHGDMLTLASAFGIELIDTQSMRPNSEDTFFFHGQHYTMDNIVKEIGPFLERIGHDVQQLPTPLTELKNSPARALDIMSLDAYLVSLGISGWLRSFIEVAFVTENGVELGEQSALNFITMVSADTDNGIFHAFGSSDERFVVKGGVQQITNSLAAPLQRQIHTGHVLTRIRQAGHRYILTFRKDVTTVDVLADHVVLAIPFTTLRNVALDVEIPEVKKHVIHDLQYGTNGKVVMGFAEPYWKRDKHNGSILTDLPLQLVWDNTYMHGVKGAGLTLYYGGSMSRVIGMMKKDALTEMMMAHLETVWPVMKGQRPGRVERMHWPSQPFIHASYSTYGPAQWTKFYGSEGESVGALHFAGEHCSMLHKGYMNGAAETGRQAAEKILAAIA